MSIATDVSVREGGADAAQFTRVLADRTNQYFQDHGLCRQADRAMITKAALGLSYWAASYLMLFVVPSYGWAFLLAYLAHGCGHVFIFVNIGHDANHRAISQRTIVNRILSHTMDLCGVNSYMWRILHHQAHHFCPNVLGEDAGVDGRGLLRLSPSAPKRGIFRYQHLYAPLLYAVYSIDYVLLNDFRSFARPSLDPLKPIRHPAREWVRLIVMKIFYIGYMLAVPILVVGQPPLVVIVAFIVIHTVLGVSLVTFFLSSHVLTGAAFLNPDQRNRNFATHVMATTRDCAPDNPIFSWLVGGLNQHVIHHLYPNVCHTHYGKLTEILQETADEFRMPYSKTANLRQAVKQHFQLLKELGC